MHNCLLLEYATDMDTNGLASDILVHHTLAARYSSFTRTSSECMCDKSVSQICS